MATGARSGKHRARLNVIYNFCGNASKRSLRLTDLTLRLVVASNLGAGCAEKNKFSAVNPRGKIRRMRSNHNL